jgi:hypothetical protein
MPRNEHENQAARNGMTNGKLPSFRGIYFIGLAATAIGIGVIIFLNLATPLEYMHNWLRAPDQIKVHQYPRRLRGIANLAFLLLLSCPLLLLIIRNFLRPLSEYFNLLRAGQKSEDLLKKARQRLINLPFMLVPINLGIWILVPAALYYAAYATGNLTSQTAVILDRHAGNPSVAIGLGDHLSQKIRRRDFGLLSGPFSGLFYHLERAE